MNKAFSLLTPYLMATTLVLEFSCLLGLITNGTYVRSFREKLVAVESAFWWTLWGTESTSFTATYLMSTRVMHVGMTAEPYEISLKLRSFWELERPGIVNDARLTAKDDKVLQAFEESILHKNGRYEVTLPRRENASDLVDKNCMTSHRLCSLTAILLCNEKTILNYDQVIRSYLQAVHDEEVNELGESLLVPIYYMPSELVGRKDWWTGPK